MTRFIHTADWQIGKPYRQIADEQKRFRLQQERLNAIGRIRDAARIQAAQFVVVAGDLFDSPTPPTTAVLEVPEAGELEQLTGRVEDPLIARVAEQLQHRLQRDDDPESEQAAIARAALCELFRFTTR